MIFSFAKNQPTNTKKLDLFLNLIPFIKIIVLMKATKKLFNIKHIFVT